MTRYLLDTNILSALPRDFGEPIRRRFDSLSEADTVYTSVIVAAEIRFGLSKKGAIKLTREMDVVLGQIAIAPFIEPMDRVYAELRADLERRGTPIGANDLWIAAQALHDGSVLVTDNEREFGRVPGLAVENWLKAAGEGVGRN